MTNVLLFYTIIMSCLIVMPIGIAIATGKFNIVSFLSISIGLALAIIIMNSAVNRYDNLEEILKNYAKVNADLNKSYNPHTLKECLSYSNQVKYDISYQFSDIINYIPKNCKIYKK